MCSSSVMRRWPVWRRWREVGGAAASRGPKRRKRRARGVTDPFRIDIDPDRSGSEIPAGGPASEAAGLEKREETVEHRGSEGGEWLQPKRGERQGWRRPGGVAVAAVTAAVAVGVMGSAKLMGGSRREAADPPVEAVADPAEGPCRPTHTAASARRPQEGLPPAANARARGADVATPGLLDGQAGGGGSLYPCRCGAVAALPRWRLR